MSADRVHAKVAGYALHFVSGLVFALGYWAVFAVTGKTDVLIGGLLGVVHGLFAGTALISILLPAVHPGTRR